MQKSDKLEEFALLCEKSVNSKSLINIIFAKSNGEIIKSKGTLKNISNNTVIQFEHSLSEGRVKQDNVKEEDIYKYIISNSISFKEFYLNDISGSATLLESKKGKVSLITKGKIGEVKTVDIVKNDEKQYILNGDEQFLIEIGISDKTGRIHDKRQSKFRQINRFLEHIEDISKYLPKSGELRIADLCCGKSYLSFAVYYYFSNIKKRTVIMDCIDLKESVMKSCAEIAEKCKFDGMKFIAGDVTKYTTTEPPHMVISLHACDIATDIVLDKAASLCADVVMMTPCCHRDLSRRLKCDSLSFISDNAVLKYKFCDAATDALRVMRLKALGYSTDAVEMIDPDETPKNVLIRAHLNKGISYKNADEQLLKKYKEAYRFLCDQEPPELPEKVF